MIRRRLVALVTSVTVLAACHRARQQDTNGAFVPLQAGTHLARYARTDLAGDSVVVASKEPLTLVNVWATWCTSCREEMTELQALQHEFGPRGLRVISISIDGSGDAKVERFVEEEHLTMPVVHDPESTVTALYNVPAVPTTILVDTAGVVRWVHTGNIASVSAQARAAIAAQLGKTAAPSS